jgi:hypothetical protein
MIYLRTIFTLSAFTVLSGICRHRTFQATPPASDLLVSMMFLGTHRDMQVGCLRHLHQPGLFHLLFLSCGGQSQQPSAHTGCLVPLTCTVHHRLSEHDFFYLFFPSESERPTLRQLYIFPARTSSKHSMIECSFRNRNGPARPTAAGRCGRPVRRAPASTRRASGDGARCKNARDSTTGGAVRAGCGTVGRVTGKAGRHALSAE